METLLTVILPFFALTFCGYFAARGALVPPAGVAGLNAFVFWFALPAMLFLSLYRRDFADLVRPDYVAAYAGITLIFYAATVLAVRLIWRLAAGQAAVFAMASTFPNTGYMGLPLMTALLGPGAAAPVILLIVSDMMITMPITVAIIEGGRGERGNVRVALRNVGRGLVRNPLLWSIILGFVASGLHIPIPEAGLSFLALIGGAAGPVALFALGGSLAGRPLSSNLGESLGMVGAKLLVHPLLVGLAFHSLFRFEPLWSTTAVLLAALPVAGTVYVVAQQYDTYVARASTAILLSTALAVVSFSALVWYHGL
jgi:malonate transporter and related proteins